MKATFLGSGIPSALEADLQGRLIVIEGPDCVGRTTQIRRLKDWLENLGYGVVTTSLCRSELAEAGHGTDPRLAEAVEFLARAGRSAATRLAGAHLRCSMPRTWRTVSSARSCRPSRAASSCLPTATSTPSSRGLPFAVSTLAGCARRTALP